MLYIKSILNEIQLIIEYLMRRHNLAKEKLSEFENEEAVMTLMEIKKETRFIK